MTNTITVNGVPLEKHVAVEIGKEIHQTREGENRFKLYRPIKTKQRSNISGAKSGKTETLVAQDVSEHVILCGQVFLSKDKQPFGVSGQSLFGALEYRQEDDSVRCHECGEWMKSLGNHIRSHGLTSGGYKTKHGLNLKSPLEGLSCKAKRRAVALSVGLGKPGITTRANGGNRASGVKRMSQGIERKNIKGNCPTQIAHKIATAQRVLRRELYIDDLPTFGIPLKDWLLHVVRHPEDLPKRTAFL